MQNRALFAAAAFSMIVGVAGLVGTAVILLLFANASIYMVPVVGPLFRSFIGQTLYLGIFVVVASVAHIAVSILLWRKRKLGGKMGFLLSACEVVAYLSVFIYPNLAIPMVASLGLGSALYVLILAVWDGLS